MTILGYNIRYSELHCSFGEHTLNLLSSSFAERATEENSEDLKSIVKKCESVNCIADIEIGAFDNNCKYQPLTEPEFGFTRIFRVGVIDSKHILSHLDIDSYIENACKSLCQKLWNIACLNAEYVIRHYDDGFMSIDLTDKMIGDAFNQVKVELPEGVTLIIHEWISNCIAVIG